jgi:hypothetical protein
LLTRASSLVGSLNRPARILAPGMKLKVIDASVTMSGCCTVVRLLPTSVSRK